MKNVFVIALTLLTAIATIGQTNYSESSDYVADPSFDENRKLVVIISQGADNERASIAWGIANGGIKNGLDVSVFLVGPGVDWARKSMGQVRLNPLDPTLGEMIQSAIDAGTKIGVCPPCVNVRGIDAHDMREEVEVVGSSFIHDAVKEGAAVITF